MMTKTCSICNQNFKTNSQNQRNCKLHKGLNYKVYKVIDSILMKKCSKCKDFKDMKSFYKKSTSLRGSSWCTKCFNSGTYLYQKDRALSRKLEVVKSLGGKCVICGYNRNLCSLAFHHINDSLKSFELDARNLANRSIDQINHELKKCILVCHNCHMEIHWPKYDNLLLPIELPAITFIPAQTTKIKLLIN